MTEAAQKERWTRIGIRAWAIIGVLILIALAIYAVIHLWDALWPFVVALVVVVALNGPVTRLVKLGWPRARATAVVFLAFIVVTGLASWLLFPILYERVAELVQALPGYAAVATRLLQGLIKRGKGADVPTWVPQVIQSVQANVTALASDISGQMAGAAAEAVAKALDILVKVLLGLLVAFYVLMDLSRLREELMRLAAERHRDELAVVFDKVSATLGGWLRGTFFDSLIIGVMYMVAFTALGVPYGYLIGLLGGVTNFIPWIGPAITLVLAGIAALFVSPVTALGAAIAVIVIRQIDDFFVAPRVMSENVDLHPVLVIFSLLAGATLFGFVGLLLAIPLAAIAKALFVYFYERGTRRTLATEDGVLFRLTGDEDEGASEDARKDDAPDAGEES